MQNIFLHANSSNVNSSDKLNVILSPQLYWVRIFELPLKNTKEVLEVLPSLFEDFIKEENLSYYCIKQDDNRYLSFAYDEKRILEYLKKTNIKLSQISGVYFAQNEFDSLVKQSGESCMKVDNVCLSFINNLLVQIPLMLKTNIDNSIDIQNIPLSKHKIYIDNSSKYLDAKSSYFLSVVFLVIMIVNFIKVVDINIHNNGIIFKQNGIQEKYNMPQSLLQTRSIIKNLTKVQNKQLSVRKLLGYILDAKKRFNLKILDIKYTNNGCEVKFTEVKAKKITNYLQKRYELTSAVVKDSVVKIGIKL